MQFQKKVQKKQLCKEVTNVLQGLLQLSEKSAEVLSVLMEIDLNWTPVTENAVKDVLSTDSRKIIMESTGIAKTNITKYITPLIKNNILYINDKGGYEVNKSLLPTYSKEVQVVFKFILDETATF